MYYCGYYYTINIRFMYLQSTERNLFTFVFLSVVTDVIHVPSLHAPSGNTEPIGVSGRSCSAALILPLHFPGCCKTYPRHAYNTLCPKSPSARGLVACLPVRLLFKSTKQCILPGLVYSNYMSYCGDD